MRKYLILLLLACSADQAQSQVLISLLFGDKLNAPGTEYGHEGGVNFITMGGLESSDYLSTFNLGFYFDIRLKDPWYLYNGVLVKSQMGTNGLPTALLDFLQTDIYPEEQLGLSSEPLVDLKMLKKGQPTILNNLSISRYISTGYLAYR